MRRSVPARNMDSKLPEASSHTLLEGAEAANPPEGGGRSMLLLVVAVVIALTVLSWYASKKIVPEDFALGNENFHRRETWEGAPFTAAYVSDMAAVLNALQAPPQT